MKTSRHIAHVSRACDTSPRTRRYRENAAPAAVAARPLGAPGSGLSETDPLPGIAVSGFGMDGDVKDSLEAGFCAHLTKPVDVAQLDLLIRGALARKDDRSVVATGGGSGEGSVIAGRSHSDGNDSTINQIGFGDGNLNVADLFVTFRRALDPTLVWYQRYWSNGVLRAQAIPNTFRGQLTQFSASSFRVEATQLPHHRWGYAVVRPGRSDEENAALMAGLPKVDRPMTLTKISTDEGVSGVNRRPDGDRPHRRRPRVGGAVGQVERGPDAGAGMVGAAHPTEEQADDLVTDELVDEPVVVDDGAGRELVEAVEESMELRGPHLLAQCRRAAHVREQERARDLDTGQPALGQLDRAFRAQHGVGRAAETPHPERSAADATEWDQAQLAPRLGGDVLEPPAVLDKAGVHTHHVEPDVLGRHLRIRPGHVTNVRRLVEPHSPFGAVLFSGSRFTV